MFIAMAYLLHSSCILPYPVWVAAAGTSAYHLLQLSLDELGNMVGQGGLRRLGRDSHMVAGAMRAACIVFLLQTVLRDICSTPAASEL